MEKERLIKHSLNSLQKLSVQKINEVVDFIDFISEKYKDEVVLQKGIQNMMEQSVSFSFLKDEEDLYSVEDLKEKY